MDRGAPSRAVDPDAVHPEPTLDVLADLQAGLLDDAAAARVRRQAREDPHVAARLAALDRVRVELRAFGHDADSAPPAPAVVTARMESALRAADRCRLRLVVACIGAAAAVVACVLGTIALLRAPVAPSPVAQPDRLPLGQFPLGQFPLGDAQLFDLLRRSPDFGPLTDPRRRASCLAGLDYAASTAPLGAALVAPRGEPVVILLLPEDASRGVRAVAVSATCNAADTGLSAETTFQRP